MTFKKGAFVYQKPVKILCIKFANDRWIPFEDMIDLGLPMLMYFSNWWNSVEVYEFEGVYDPAYLNLNKNDPEAWKIYAEKVRTIMAKCLNIPKTNMGYRDD